MDTSKLLGKTIGIYLIIISIAMLSNMPQFIMLVESLIQNRPLMFVAGCFALILGILIVVTHNIWQWHWRVIITILGWVLFLKGASLVLYPQFIDHLSMLFVKNQHVPYFAAYCDLALGLILSYCGFKR